jgi:integrase
MFIKLTDETVRTLPAKDGKDTLYPDSDSRNGVSRMYLRVRPGGSRTFILQWRKDGIQRRITIGKAGLLKLEDARKRARKELVGIDDGHDPAVVKAKARVDDRQIFEAVAQRYLEHRKGNMREGSLYLCQLHLLTYFKPLHRLPLQKIERAMVADELETIAKKRGKVAADRGRSSLSAFYTWCIGTGLAKNNPVSGTFKHSEGKSRERVLTDSELVKIWNASSDGAYGRIVKLLLLTGQRRDEIAELKWAEISDEGDTISLPSSRTKNNRQHDIPLSPQARAVVAEVPKVDDRDNIFGRGKNGFSGFSRSKEALDEACGVVDWTLHDLRRTAATRMSDLGVQPHIVEAVLNHVSGHKAGVAGIYNRSAYAAEKRVALDLWGMHVQTLLARAEGANVMTLRASAMSA